MNTKYPIRAVCCLLALVILPLAGGCASPPAVHHDYDPAIDFHSYQTFAWLPQPTMSTTGVASDAEVRNQLLDKRILRAVGEGLTAKGLTVDTENPDLMLAYHIGVADKISVSNWGYGYPRGYGRWGGGGGSSTDISSYTEGTLILDFVDGKTKELVWRATGTDALRSNPTPEQVDKGIEDIVTRMLAMFPPKQ